MVDGLLDRFLFCYPKHSHTYLSDVEIGPDTEAEYAGLYAKLSSLRMVEDEIGQEAPNVVPMSREARRLFKEIHDEVSREALEPGFPLRLQGVWAKMQAYLARISLVLALCRCVEHSEPEQVEEEDVKNAARIVAYFKAHARRVYGTLRATTPEDLLAGEIQDLLHDHDGKWSGSATELYNELDEREARPCRGCQGAALLRRPPGLALTERPLLRWVSFRLRRSAGPTPPASFGRVRRRSALLAALTARAGQRR
jgi:putative DNA primase/helicase